MCETRQLPVDLSQRLWDPSNLKTTKKRGQTPYAEAQITPRETNGGENECLGSDECLGSGSPANVQHLDGPGNIRMRFRNCLGDTPEQRIQNLRSLVHKSLVVVCASTPGSGSFCGRVTHDRRFVKDAQYAGLSFLVLKTKMESCRRGSCRNS